MKAVIDYNVFIIYSNLMNVYSFDVTRKMFKKIFEKFQINQKRRIA